MVKTLLLFTILTSLIFSACSTSDTESTSDSSSNSGEGELSGKTGTLQEPKVYINKLLVGDGNSLGGASEKQSKCDDTVTHCVRKKVPHSIWDTITESIRAYNPESQRKEPFCEINEHKNGAGVPFEIGTKIEVIGAPTNDCQHTMIMRPGMPLSKLPTALVKVKVLDGPNKGLEGWTWSSAIAVDGK